MHGACPNAVNDENTCCGHWKHNLYWDILGGKVEVCEDPITADTSSAYSSEVVDIVDDMKATLVIMHFGIGN